MALFVSSGGLEGAEAFTLLLGIEVAAYFFIASAMWFHIMVIFIIMEFLTLKIFTLSLFFILTSSSISFIFFLITLGVAEASLAMSLLTLMIRAHGNDYVMMAHF